MYGIICEDNLPGHSLFANFRLALKNYLNCDFKDIKSVDDLNSNVITTLFIVDEHFDPHVRVWKNDEFIKRANSLNVKVLIFNFEKIYDAQFPWNVDHQRWVEKFNFRTQLVSDMNDMKMLKTKILNKQLLSKDTTLVDPLEKKNRILFIGQISPHVYARRKQVLAALSTSHLKDHVDIINSDRKYSYTEYLSILSSYKYIFNPLGTGDFLNIRFYEALKLGCIPIQQVTQEMLNTYAELKSNYCVTFKNVNQLPGFNEIGKLTFTSFCYYLENYFEDVNLKEHLDI